MLRILEAQPLTGRRLRLVLTDGSTIDRDVRPLLRGPIFAPLLDDDAAFRDLKVDGGKAIKVVAPGYSGTSENRAIHISAVSQSV